MSWCSDVTQTHPGQFVCEFIHFARILLPDVHLVELPVRLVDLRRNLRELPARFIQVFLTFHYVLEALPEYFELNQHHMHVISIYSTFVS